MVKFVFFIVCGVIVISKSYAQLPTCDKIYVKSLKFNSWDIYTVDPFAPLSSLNPKLNSCSPNGSIGGFGLAVSPHLGTSDSRLTFYSINFFTHEYVYYNIDSAKWLSTGHLSSTGYGPNIAGGGGYLYNIDNNGNVYRYNGFGNGSFVVNVSTFRNCGPFDLIADCQGNFYLLSIANFFSTYRKYNPNGVLLQTWSIANNNNIIFNTNNSGGLAMIGDRLFFDYNSATTSFLIYSTVKTNVVDLDSIRQMNLQLWDDMASCAGFTLTLPTINIAANQGSVCQGSTVHFQSSTTTAGTHPKYQWLVNGTKVGTDSSGFSYIPNDGDTVQCVMSSSDYCASQVEATSNAVVMKVLAYTTPTVKIAASDTGIICAGTRVVFRGTSSHAGNAPGYQWYKNGAMLAGARFSNYTASSPASGDSFSVVVHSSALCNTVDSAVSTSLGIQLGIPHPSVSLSATNPAPLCSGTMIMVQATAAYPGHSPVYSWAVNGRPWAGISLGDAIFSSSFKDQDTVTLSMKSSIACASPQTVIASPLVLSIFPSITPGCNINITPGTAMCLGSPIHFVSNTVGGGTSPKYQWLLNGSPWAAASGTSYTSSSLSSGDTVSILFSSSATCALPDTVLSNRLVLLLDSVVYPSISIDSQLLGLPDGRIQYSFYAQSQYGGRQASFQWTKNGGNIAFARDSFYTSTELKAGDQIGLRMISSEPCAATRVVTAQPIVIPNRLGLGQQTRAEELFIVPNPTTGDFTLFLPSSERAMLHLMDQQGKVVFIRRVQGRNSKIQLPPSIARGLYFLRILSGKREVVIRKLIVE